MKKKSLARFYFMQTCGILSLLSVILPWISYGIGSKTGLDIAHITLFVILISGAIFLLCSYLSFKVNRGSHFYLYFALLSSIIMFATFLFELVRVVYQTMVVKSLPAEMFGVATLATAKIHVGYGLWMGAVASLLLCIVNLIVLKTSASERTQVHGN